jgi:hypothetical protein
MPATANRDLEFVAPSEGDRLSHLGGGEAAGDHSGTPVETPIPQGARLVVARIGGSQHLPPKGPPECRQSGVEYLGHENSCPTRSAAEH